MYIEDIFIPGQLFLAPMAGVTDMPFRMLCKEQGCGMVYTEMISARGLFYGSRRTRELMDLHPDEHPVGIQIFGSDPDIMAKMAERISESDVDLIDINMGCPAPKIVKNGEGSALMREPKLVGRIVGSVVRSSKKPITVKIRKGWDDESTNAVEIARIAEQEGASAVTVHGRTREQFYSGKADWEIIGSVKECVSIPVIGNGDIFDAHSAVKMKETTGCDGIMIARGAQGNPWIFREVFSYLYDGVLCKSPTARQRIEMGIRHLNLCVQYKGEKIGVFEMRKHLSWYIKGLKGASSVKKRLNSLTKVEEIENTLMTYLSELEQ